MGISMDIIHFTKTSVHNKQPQELALNKHLNMLFISTKQRIKGELLWLTHFWAVASPQQSHWSNCAPTDNGNTCTALKIHQSL